MRRDILIGEPSPVDPLTKELGVQWKSQSLQACENSQKLSFRFKNYWGERSCGVACVLMCLHYFGKGQSLNLSDLIIEGLRLNAYCKKGWIHSGLAALLKKRGLNAVPLAINSFRALELEITRSSVVIASVTRGFSTDGRKGGHLVVVDGCDPGGPSVRVVDPDPHQGKCGWMSWKGFSTSFSGRIITCHS